MKNLVGVFIYFFKNNESIFAKGKQRRFDRALQINKYSIKESIPLLQNTEFKYVDPVGGEIKEKFQMWVEEGGSVLSCFRPNNDALNTRVRYQRQLVDVLEIRLGHKTKAFEREPPTRKNHFPEASKNCFSIIFSDATLDLVAYSIQDWQIWLNVLVRLIVHWKSEPPIYQYPFSLPFLFINFVSERLFQYITIYSIEAVLGGI